MKIEEGSSRWLLVDGRKEGARVFEGSQSVSRGRDGNQIRCRAGKFSDERRKWSTLSREPVSEDLASSGALK